jgi:hypothetical protein
MREEPTRVEASLNYRAAPRPRLISELRAQVPEAQARRPEKPERLLAVLIGDVLSGLYADILIEPLPQQLRSLADSLRSARRVQLAVDGRLNSTDGLRSPR